MIRRVAVAGWLVLSAGASAAAQRPLAVAPTSTEFLSRFDFHISIAALAEDDPRFSWDAHVGGDFDALDYRFGRATVLADYQNRLGNELQFFDPNQGNYTLAASSSVRAGRTELAVVFHHVSRHLGDRQKDFAIAMNALLGRVMGQMESGGATVAVRASAGKVTQTSYVDYTWMADAEVTIRRKISPRVGWFGRLYGESYAVDPTLAGRSSQYGGRVEGGARFSGRGGALELFAGFERVVDADPRDFGYFRWAFAGFRVVGP